MATKDVEKPAMTIEEKFDLLIAALTAQATRQVGAGIDADTLKTILAENAKTTHKALRPENEQHPGISAFNPAGDIEKPREFILQQETTYRGQPIHSQWETHTNRELELLQAVQPGVYTVLRKDGYPMPVTVTVQRDASGKIVKKDISFDVSREERHYIPSMTVLLSQILASGTDVTPKQAFIAAMQEELARML